MFFFNDTTTTEIYTLSLHDALPIFARGVDCHPKGIAKLPITGSRATPLGDKPTTCVELLDAVVVPVGHVDIALRDRKSTRLNSSHANISYAVFCLKKIIKCRLDESW